MGLCRPVSVCGRLLRLPGSQDGVDPPGALGDPHGAEGKSMGAPELTEHDIRKLARITGLSVYQDQSGTYGIESGSGIPVVVSVGLTLTADDFLRANLDRLRRQLLREQEYRCAQCAGIELLQLHHRKKRSEQRDDRIENCEMICVNCHAKEHPQ